MDEFDFDLPDTIEEVQKGNKEFMDELDKLYKDKEIIFNNENENEKYEDSDEFSSNDDNIEYDSDAYYSDQDW